MVTALLLPLNSDAQFNPNCTGGVPTYNVDFSGNPQGTFEILNEIRSGNCCGTTSPDRCLRININPDTGAVAVLFEVTDGSLSPGALFYQINCGVQTQVGQAACVSGPSVLTFCKPGNNTNSYRLTSIPRPTFPTTDTVRQSCPDTIRLLGFRPDSVRITSVFPGTRGQYNSYLSCTSGCDQIIFTAAPNAPQYVEYEVCGYPIADQCSFTATLCNVFRVYIRPELNISVTPNPASFCPTSPTVTLTGAVTGGLAPYTYTWYNGSTVVSSTNTYVASAVGTYSLVVGDAFGSGCPTGAINVPVSFQNLNTTIDPVNVSCAGLNDGTAAAVITGGSAPFVYSWSNSETTASVSGLAPGSYSVTITDYTGCTTASSVTITEPLPLAIGLDSVVDVGCNGESTGAVYVSVGGGTPGYAYLWSNGATTQNIVGVVAGNYTLTVTDSLGCTTQFQQRVDEPTTLDPLISGTSFNVTNVSCYGGADGEVTVIVQGGVGPYSYLWSNGASDSAVTGLTAGPLEVSIVDANGCSAIANVTLTEPDSLSLSVLNIQTYFGFYNISCNGASDGAVDIQVQGGTPPYAFAWSNGAVTEDLSNIPAGVYDLTVTDTLGCTAQLSVTLTEPDPLVVSLTSPTFGNGYNIACKGENSGRIFSTVTGGAGPYNYTWQPGGSSTPDSLVDLYAGDYRLDIVDQNGCIATDSITLTEPDTLVPLITSTTIGFTNIACFGNSDGTATVNVVGGTPPFIYQWSNGDTTATADSLSAGTVFVYVVDYNGCTGDTASLLTEPNQLLAGLTVSNDVLCYGTSTGNALSITSGGTPPYIYVWSNGNTTNTLSNVAAGDYAVLIVDSNGCTTTDSVSILEPPVLNAALQPFTFPSGNNISCAGANDGSIDLTVTGGTQAYSYSWSNLASTEDISNLAPGTYSVTVSDANGCTAQQSVTLTEPTLLLTDTIFSVQQYGGVNVSCNGGTDGQIEVVASGGSAPYTYSWTNGGTTAVISGVSVDTFVVTVTDVNGCTAIASIRITEPTLLSSSVGSQTDVDCNGNSTGSVTISPSGSTPPYQYSIDGGTTWQSSAVFNGLATGPYNIIVRDTNGCTITQGVTIGQPSSGLSASSNSVISADCNGASTGSLTASASGGTTPYQYSIDNSPLQSSGQFTGLSSGTYTITATDANGCTTSFDVTITQPAPLDITANSGSTPAPCATNNGAAFVDPVGGTAPFTYVWSGPDTSTGRTVSPARPGTYMVMVQDANGCEAQLTIIVVEDSCDFGMPDGFSPNGDGRNDDFEVRGTDKYPDNILIVFNRWGNQVYSKEDYTGHEWKGENDKGEPLPEGTYFVVFSAVGSDFKANTFVDIRR